MPQAFSFVCVFFTVKTDTNGQRHRPAMSGKKPGTFGAARPFKNEGKKQNRDGSRTQALARGLSGTVLNCKRLTAKKLANCHQMP
jgi:hypothetical protein